MSSKIRIQKICEFCNEEFTAKTTVTRFCGDRCASRGYKARKRAEKINQSIRRTQQSIEQPIRDLQAKDFLTIKDASSLLNISRTTIWRLMKSKKLKATKIGSRVIIKKSAISSLFE